MSEAPVSMWLAEPLPEDVGAALRRLRRAGDVHRVAVMPDVHLANEVCIGTVVATRRRLYPAAVGGDIGCGVSTLRFPGVASAVDEAFARRLLSALPTHVPVMRRPAPGPPWSDGLDPAALSAPELRAVAVREGRRQQGTLGRGNHFLELQTDDDGDLWVMVHSGSRALGPAIARHHRARAEPGSGGLCWLDADSAAGRAYLDDVAWALEYADCNRAHMLAAVGALLMAWLGARPDGESLVSCHHNHVRRETHAGVACWVHRKGAIPAAAGEPGIIPGSAGSPSFHVIGRGVADALASSSHGAGRRMSRATARRRISPDRLRHELSGVFFDHRRARQLVEEAPGAYKDINAVMRAQRRLTRVVREVRPLLSYKGV